MSTSTQDTVWLTQAAHDRLQSELDELTARAGDGTVQAKGFISLASADGYPMNIAATLDNARLAKSENIAARATGNLTLEKVAGSELCEVWACTDCSSLHLSIGPFSLRLRAEHFRTVSDTLRKALQAVDERRSLHALSALTSPEDLRH